MTSRRPGDKPLSEPLMASLLMHIYIPQPQWINIGYPIKTYLKLKSHENSFVHNTHFCGPIILKICSEHHIVMKANLLIVV